MVPQVFHLRTEAAQDLERHAHVRDVRHVGQDHRLVGQQAGGQHLQGGVFVAAVGDLALETVVALDHKLLAHRCS